MVWVEPPLGVVDPQAMSVTRSASAIGSLVNRLVWRSSSSNSVTPSGAEPKRTFTLAHLRHSRHSTANGELNREAEGAIDEDVENTPDVSVPWQPPWVDPTEFAESERSRRLVNSLDGAEMCFVSHCWRDPDTQLRKRRLLDHFSKRSEDGGLGFYYWADFLDLQAEGPVPWRAEIEAGIAACSKFVALVDKAWLTSYNCLQELALACQHSKPLVILVLTQEAWDLLTVPGGAELVKSEADSQQGPREVWTDAAHGPPLCLYEGEPIVAGQPISLRIVQDLLARLSAINMCPCRPREEEARGFEGLASLASAFVQKDMVYQKEHAQLKNKALEWENCVRTNQPLPLLQGQEAVKWDLWLTRAMDMGTEPRPIQLQKQFVRDSLKSTYRRKKVVRAMAIALVLIPLLAAGVISSTLLAVKSTNAQADLEDALEDLEKETQVALDAKDAAEKAQAEAVAQSLKAMASSALATATSVSFLMNRGQSASTWEFKLLSEGLERLPNANTAAINTTLVTAGRDLLAKSYSFLKQTLKGHAATISSSSWSPDGSWVASCGYDGSTRLWAVAPDGVVSETSIVLYDDPKAMVNMLCWLGDSRALVGASLDGSVRVWDLADPLAGVPPPVLLLEGGNVFSTLDCAAAVPRLAGGLYTGELMVWDDVIAQPYSVQTFQAHTGPINSAAWKSDGSCLATTMGNGVAVWHMLPNGTIDNGLPAATLTGHKAPVTSLSWDAEGEVLASGSDDMLVRLWRPMDSTTSLAAFPGHSESVWSLRWAPSSRVLASLSKSGSVMVWRVPEGDIASGGVIVETLAFEGLAASGFVSSLSWGPGGESLLFSFEEDLLLWAAGFDGAVPRAVPGSLYEGILALVPPVWHPSGLAALSTDQQSILVWPADRNNTVPLPQVLDGTSSKLTALAWAPTGDQIAAATGDGSLALWPAEPPSGVVGSAELVSVPNNFGGGVTRLAWSSNGQMLAGGGPGLGSVVVWALDPPGVEEVEPLVFVAHPAGVSWMGWASSSSTYQLASTSLSDNTIRVWTLAMDGPLISIKDQDVLEGHTAGIIAATWGPTGLSLASVSLDGTARAWSSNLSGTWTSQQLQLGALPSQTEIGLVQPPVWAADGRALAIASTDSVLLWPVLKNGTLAVSAKQELAAHSATVTWLSWSPDSQLLATASKDRTLHVWAVGSDGTVDGGYPMVLEAPMEVLWAGWSPNGNSLAGVVSDGKSSSMMEWDLLTVSSLSELLAALPLQDWGLTELEKKSNSIPPVLFDYPAVYSAMTSR